MKKKIMAVCLTVCLAAVAVIGGTLAYFTDKDEAENVFTVGNVNIDLTTSHGRLSAKTLYARRAINPPARFGLLPNRR